MSLSDDILARQDLSALVAARDSEGVAAAISAGRVKIVSRPIGIGSVLDVLGPANGAALLDALDALRSQVSAIKWAWVLLERGELDVGLASTRGQIDALTGDGLPFTAEAAGAIQALAEVPAPVSAPDVYNAMGWAND